MDLKQSHPDPHPLAAETLGEWGRPLAILTALVFVISSAFPVVAGVSRNTAAFPKWWGVLDVALAFVLAMLAIGVMALFQGRVDQNAERATYRAYRILIHAIFVMIVIFFLCGERIVWINCLTGLAWRSWLLMYGLPAWLSAFKATARNGADELP